MSYIKGIHHVALKCNNEEEYRKTLDFYAKVLGLPVLRSWDTGSMLDTGDGILEIFNDGVEERRGGIIYHFALATDDVDGVCKAVSEAGYEVFEQPKDIVINSDPAFPARIAFCYGPLGEEIEFFHEIH